MKIYLASSWKNTYYPSVLAALRAAGHDVYDFRNPGDGTDGFKWSNIDPDWQNWTLEEYKCQLIGNPLAEQQSLTRLNVDGIVIGVYSCRSLKRWDHQLSKDEIIYDVKKYFSNSY